MGYGLTASNGSSMSEGITAGQDRHDLLVCLIKSLRRYVWHDTGHGVHYNRERLTTGLVVPNTERMRCRLIPVRFAE